MIKTFLLNRKIIQNSQKTRENERKQGAKLKSEKYF